MAHNSEESHNQVLNPITVAQLQAQVHEIDHFHQALHAHVQFLSQKNEQLRLLHEREGRHDPPLFGAGNLNVPLAQLSIEDPVFPPLPRGPPPLQVIHNPQPLIAHIEQLKSLSSYPKSNLCFPSLRKRRMSLK